MMTVPKILRLSEFIDCQYHGINHLLEMARMKGLKKVYLRVDTSDSRAVHVYERCGFEIEGRFNREHYVKGEFRHDYRMAIFL